MTKTLILTAAVLIPLIIAYLILGVSQRDAKTPGQWEQNGQPSSSKGTAEFNAGDKETETPPPAVTFSSPKSLSSPKNMVDEYDRLTNQLSEFLESYSGLDDESVLKKSQELLSMDERRFIFFAGPVAKFLSSEHESLIPQILDSMNDEPQRKSLFSVYSARSIASGSSIVSMLEKLDSYTNHPEFLGEFSLQLGSKASVENSEHLIEYINRFLDAAQLKDENSNIVVDGIVAGLSKSDPNSAIETMAQISNRTSETSIAMETIINNSIEKDADATFEKFQTLAASTLVADSEVNKSFLADFILNLKNYDTERSAIIIRDSEMSDEVREYIVKKFIPRYNPSSINSNLVLELLPFIKDQKIREEYRSLITTE